MQKFYVLYAGDTRPHPVWAMCEADVRNGARSRAFLLTVLTEDEFLS